VLESTGAPTDAVREAYERTASDGATTREARALALGRLVELEQLRSVEPPEAQHAEALRGLMPELRTNPDAELTRLRDAFKAALALSNDTERNAELTRLREELARSDSRAPLPVRRTMGIVLRMAQQERTNRVLNLERELDEARAAGKLARMLELRHQLRELSQEPDSRQLLARWMSSWRVRATRLLAQGQIEEAARICRSFEPNAQPQELPEDLAEALTSVTALCEREDLTADERAALLEFHRALETLVDSRQTESARAALRCLPYPLR